MSPPTPRSAMPLCATSDSVCLSVCLSCLSVCLLTLSLVTKRCTVWRRFNEKPSVIPDCPFALHKIWHCRSTSASQQQRRPTTSHAAYMLLFDAENKHFSFSLCADGKPGGTGSEQGASCPARPAGSDAAAPCR